MKKRLKIIAFAAALTMLSGCGEPKIREVMADIPDVSEEQTTPPPETTVSETTSATTTTAQTTTLTTTMASLTTTSYTGTTDAETSVSYTYENVDMPDLTIGTAQAAAQNVLYDYDRMVPSAAYKEFYSKCVFVGDSICRGFKAYDVLPANQVCAQGNTAARNILEYTFKVPGYTGDLMSCLKYLNPEYIVFSMGMNDVNMTSAEKFCENYGHLLALTENAVPNAKLIVCSVTPILTTSRFCSNTRIDNYNATLKNYLDATGKWTFVDISHGLKNRYNGLKDNYNGGDGIHLSGAAYHAILYQIAERIVDKVVYDADGNMIHLDAPVTGTTTPAPEESSKPDVSGETSAPAASRTASDTSETSKTSKPADSTKPTEASSETPAAAQAPDTPEASADNDTTTEP